MAKKEKERKKMVYSGSSDRTNGPREWGIREKSLDRVGRRGKMWPRQEALLIW